MALETGKNVPRPRQLTDQLDSHPADIGCFTYLLKQKGTVVCISAHALAECYATLTALPLRRRISGPEALRLIEANINQRLKVISLTQTDYHKARRLVANLGRISGQIYDALHLTAVKKEGCERLYTNNHRHFQGLDPSIEIVSRDRVTQKNFPSINPLPSAGIRLFVLPRSACHRSGIA